MSQKKAGIVDYTGVADDMTSRAEANALESLERSARKFREEHPLSESEKAALEVLVKYTEESVKRGNYGPAYGCTKCGDTDCTGCHR